MPRKKKEAVVSVDPVNDTEVAVSELPLAIPVEVPAQTPVTEAVPVPQGTPPVPSQNGNGTRRPLISYRLMAARDVSFEVSVWSNVYKTRDGSDEYEQLSMTCNRSYRDQNGAWVKGGSFRTHEIPCLLFLLQKAHGFALDRRTDDSSLPF